MTPITRNGFSLIEAVVGIAVVALVAVGVAQSIGALFDASRETVARLQATYLAEEGLELLRFVRDDNWNTISGLSVDTPYYFSVSTSTIATTAVPEIIDGTFRRHFTLSEVSRNGDDDIAPLGSVDAGARFAEVSVGYGTATVTLQTLLTNLYDI